MHRLRVAPQVAGHKGLQEIPLPNLIRGALVTLVTFHRSFTTKMSTAQTQRYRSVPHCLSLSLPPSPLPFLSVGRLRVTGAGNTAHLRPLVSCAARPNAARCAGWVGAGAQFQRHFAVRAKGKGTASSKAAASRALGKYRMLLYHSNNFA